jgi:arginine-tRNA-protein transferase
MVPREHVTFIENEAEQIKSLGTPFGRSSSTCGYCSPVGERSKEYSSYRVAGLNATRLTCEVDLIPDLGNWL